MSEKRPPKDVTEAGGLLNGKIVPITMINGKAYWPGRDSANEPPSAIDNAPMPSDADFDPPPDNFDHSVGPTPEQVVPLGPPPSANRFVEHWRTIGEISPDWLDVEPPQRDWLLKRDGVPVLGCGLVGMLVAPGGRGKTMALIDLAVAVATGRRWLQTFDVITPGPVVLALAEEDLPEVRRRIYYITRALGLNAHERRLLSERLIPMGLAGEQVSLVEVEKALVRYSEVHKHFIERVSQQKHPLIILDPLSRWAPGVESDNSIATAAVQALEQVAQAANGTVIIAHHTAKWSRREGNKGGDASGARGVTGLTDAVRWCASIEGSTETDIRLVVTKANYAPKGEPLDLVRDKDTGILRPPTSWELDQARVESAGRNDAVRAEVYAAIEASPGISTRALRLAVKARGAVVDASLESLIEDREVIKSVAGRGYAYSVREAEND